MTFAGITRCPRCDGSLEDGLRDVLRKAEGEHVARSFECRHCRADVFVQDEFRKNGGR